jgi:hypothetical protein
MKEKLMSGKGSVMKIPEFIILFKPLVIGFLLAEVWIVACSIGTLYAVNIATLSSRIRLIGIAAILCLCMYYLYKREAHKITMKMIKSFRIDLLFALFIGIYLQILAYPAMEHFHLKVFTNASHFVPVIVLILLLSLISPIFQNRRAKQFNTVQKNHFISDVEIKKDTDDLFNINEQATSFAESVIQSRDVFGVDGPWGIGKTSFINLAENIWAKNNKFLVCRFEPLRYASQPDLTDRLVQELTSTIQRSIYAPEFKLAANRYSRLLKGKAEVSFFGFKLSVDPSSETVDDLLNDIDEVLKRVNRRVIIVIDDLDRLDAKTVNNILFATKRTLKLTQATYVLCYDTEVLAGGQEENSRAREFLEKFVTIKYSLFADTSKICDFLRGKWKDSVIQDGTTPPDAITQLSGIFDELADILESDKAAHYFPLVGNMRKVKRLINTIRLMQIERTNLGRTDFNRRDLINLILLHLNYPGLFRQIYAEETGGNIGSFSTKYNSNSCEHKNSVNFEVIIKNSKDVSATFLLKQLFDIGTLEWSGYGKPEESDLASRACFNHYRVRNLEDYLKLIVRVVTPEPQATLILYKEALNKIRNGESIISILDGSDFTSENWELAHERLWIEILNQSNNLSTNVVDEAIDTLVDYLPNYPLVKSDGRTLRKTLIYTLLQLLDRASWGADSNRRDSESAFEIAWRIFGKEKHSGKGLLNKLVGDKQGAIGWYDLLFFRLQCSADRQGQIHSLVSALIRHQDPDAKTSGRVDELAVIEMRLISQKIFGLFKSTYIKPKINFVTEVDLIHDDEFLGSINCQLKGSDFSDSVAQQILINRSAVKSFVLYQISNSLPPTGSGVGCGYYDEDGKADNKGIATAMNNYMFNFCFNPVIDEKNALHFFDYCLTNLTTPFHTGDAEQGLVALKSSLAGGLDPMAMGRFWTLHEKLIRQLVQSTPKREVHQSNYSVKYLEIMDKVFSTLDEMANDKEEPEIIVENIQKQ